MLAFPVWGPTYTCDEIYDYTLLTHELYRNANTYRLSRIAREYGLELTPAHEILTRALELGRREGDERGFKSVENDLVMITIWLRVGHIIYPPCGRLVTCAEQIYTYITMEDTGHTMADHIYFSNSQQPKWPAALQAKYDAIDGADVRRWICTCEDHQHMPAKPTDPNIRTVTLCNKPDHQHMSSMPVDEVKQPCKN